MSNGDDIYRQVEQDIWAWIHEFVTAKNEFYHYKFAPCPYAQQAVASKTVDVLVWKSGDVRQFIRDGAIGMRDCPKLTTRVMAFPPKVRFQWGINDFVEQLNAELIPTNVFLNTGIAKTTHSKYPESNSQDPYYIVVANSLDAVLSGAEALRKTDYYKNWPAAHYELVVERRARLARQYRGKVDA
jgi:hypothetical protein